MILIWYLGTGYEKSTMKILVLFHVSHIILFLQSHCMLSSLDHCSASARCRSASFFEVQKKESAGKRIHFFIFDYILSKSHC